MASTDTSIDTVLSSYRKWLLKMANVYMPYGNDADILDLAQEGHIAMWKALKKYDSSKGALPSWLTKAAKMRMSDVLRRGNFTGHTGVRGHHTESPATPVDPQDDKETFDSLICGDEWVEGVILAYHRGEISKALNDLTAKQREYVIRRFWCCETAKELDAFVGYNHSALWKTVKPKLAKRLEALASTV